MVGAPVMCSCPHGYSGTGYSSRPPIASQDYYIKIRHTDRLDYGWRVNEVVLYTDTECSSAVKYKDIKLAPTAAGYPTDFTSGDTKTLITDLTETLNYGLIYTGEFG